MEDGRELTRRIAQAWEKYAEPADAREKAAQVFEQEEDFQDVAQSTLRELNGLRLEAIEDGREPDARALADEIGLSVYPVRRMLARLEDDEKSDKVGPAIFRRANTNTPPPIPLDDGDVPMIGSLPGGVRCGQRLVLKCGDCAERWSDDEQFPDHPHPYTQMQRPAGCEKPDCQICKQIYVPTRAAAGAIRVQQFLDQQAEHGQDIVLRHVVVSPPQDHQRIQALAESRGQEPSRELVGQIESEVADLVERKGALASIVVRHPWRGWWDDRGWRESWHWHVLAAFPADQAHEAGPRGWTHEFAPGGATCCACATQDAPSGPCCAGDCQDYRCAARRAAALQDRVNSLGGKLGAARRYDRPDDAARYAAELDRLKREKAALQCDRGWLFRVTEDRHGDPIEVSQEHHQLQGGRLQGLTVPSGVLALLQYELDHAGSVRDETGSTRLHTVKWFGAWSYRKLKLGEREKAAADELKNGETHAACNNCGEEELDPVTSPSEVSLAESLLTDPAVRERRIQQRQRWSALLGWHDTEPPPDDEPETQP